MPKRPPSSFVEYGVLQHPSQSHYSPTIELPCRERETGEVAAAKYLRQEKSKVRREAAILRSLIQSAFVVRLAGLYESNLNSVLVTEYLAGGDLVTRSEYPRGKC